MAIIEHAINPMTDLPLETGNNEVSAVSVASTESGLENSVRSASVTVNTKHLEYIRVGNEYRVAGIGSVDNLKVYIDSTFEGLPVTGIDSQAFWNTNITEVVIPQSVRVIGGDAFASCDDLQSVTFEHTNNFVAYFVDTVGWGKVFGYCNSGSVSNCVKGVYLCDSPLGPVYRVTFSNVATQVWSLTFRNSTATSGAQACTINYADVNMPSSYMPNGACWAKNPDWVQGGDAPTGWFLGMNYLEEACDYEDADPWIYLGPGVFRGCNSLTEVNLPRNVRYLPNEAFAECTGLHTVTYGGSKGSPASALYSIRQAAFRDCYSLCEAPLTEFIESIDNSAFALSRVQQVKLPAFLKYLGESVFEGCPLTTVTCDPNTAQLIHIGAGAFTNCYYLSSVILPKTVEAIGYYAFEGCSELETVSLGNMYGWCAANYDTGETSYFEPKRMNDPAVVAPMLSAGFMSHSWQRLSQMPAPSLELRNGTLYITDMSGWADKIRIYIDDTYSTTLYNDGSIKREDNI